MVQFRVRKPNVRGLDYAAALSLTTVLLASCGGPASVPASATTAPTTVTATSASAATNVVATSTGAPTSIAPSTSDAPTSGAATVGTTSAAAAGACSLVSVSDVAAAYGEQFDSGQASSPGGFSSCLY